MAVVSPLSRRYDEAERTIMSITALNGCAGGNFFASAAISLAPARLCRLASPNLAAISVAFIELRSHVCPACSEGGDRASAQLPKSTAAARHAAPPPVAPGYHSRRGDFRHATFVKDREEAGDVLDYLSGAGGNEVLLGAPD
jgi:hypothetical protein